MTDRLYLRISLDTKTSGSIAKQRAATRKVATTDVVEYRDESVSGSKVPFAERPAGSRLLADLATGDRVLVTKIDRAARNVRDLLDLVETIEEAGASIVFTEQNIDTSGPTGRFLLTLLGAIAELEAEIIGERRKESLAAFRVEGRHAVGRAPYGLRSVPNPAGRGLVLRPDPETAPVLREAVEAILDGDSQRAWAARVGMGHSAFGRLLRNERLAGILGYDPDGTPRLDPDMAVFSLAEWSRLKAHLDTLPEKRGHRTTTEGYGPALACGVCGDRLYFGLAANPAHSTYKCRRVLHAKGSPSASVIRANADRVIEDEFLRRFGRLPVVEEITTDSSAVRDEAVALARLRLDAARKAQDAAHTEEEDEEAEALVRAARKALRTAEAMPTETVTAEVATGETVAEVWHRSGDSERSALLVRFGRWVVEPGRLPIDEKVHLDESLVSLQSDESLLRDFG